MLCGGGLSAFLLQEVMEVEQVMDEETGLDLTNENVEKVSFLHHFSFV